jgi:PAS domain S-box-containing protein
MNTLQVDKLLPQHLLYSRIFSVVITDLSGAYLYVNNLFQENFTFVSEKLVGNHFSTTVFNNDVNFCNEAAKFCIKDPTQAVGITVRKAIENNDYNWTQWEIKCLLNEQNQPYAFVCVGFDITNKERFQQSIDEYNKKNVESSFNLNHTQYISLIKNIPGTIFRRLNNTSKSIVFISNEIFKLTGYTTAHFLLNRTNGYERLIVEEDLALVKTSISKAINFSEPYEISYRIKHKDGQIKWVCERGQFVNDKNDEAYIDGSIFDITAQITNQFELSKSKLEIKRLSLIAETTNNPVIITDTNENIIWINQAVTTITGYSETELIGKKMGFTIQENNNIPSIHKKFQDHIITKTSFKEEIYSTNKNGQLFCLEINCNPLHDDDGNYLGFMCIGNDITNKKNLQNNQDELLQRLTLATDSAKIGIWEINLSNKQVIWDATMFEIFGFNRNANDSPFQIWKKQIHPDDKSMVFRVVSDLTTGKKGMVTIIFRIVTFKGLVRFIETHAIVRKSSAQKVIQLIGTARNVTDDVLVQEKLKQQNATLRDIAFIQSHEIRRPLANILGVIEVLNNNKTIANQDILEHLIQSANELRV